MGSELIETIKSSRYFYRNHYRVFCHLLLGILIVILILAGTTLYLFLKRPEPTYYATSMDGSLASLTPVSSAPINPNPSS